LVDFDPHLEAFETAAKYFSASSLIVAIERWVEHGYG